MTDDEVRHLFEGQTAELRRHFDVSTEQVKTEVRTLAEAVGHLDEKLGRTASEIRHEMRAGFDETHSLIGDVNRRVGDLNRRVGDLNRRVGVIEEHYKQ